MSQTLVIRGRYADRSFIAEGQLPDAIGTAELVIHATDSSAPPSAAPSFFDLFGRAPNPRTADDIAEQIRQERDEWDSP